jgi:hypothetical protein
VNIFVVKGSIKIFNLHSTSKTSFTASIFHDMDSIKLQINALSGVM